MDTKTTYYNPEKNKIITLPNLEYNRDYKEIVKPYKLFENYILLPYIKNGSLNIKKIKAHKGVLLLDLINLEGILANLNLFYNFVTKNIPEYLDSVNSNSHLQQKEILSHKEKIDLEYRNKFKSIEYIFNNKESIDVWKQNSNKYIDVLHKNNELNSLLKYQNQELINLKETNNNLNEELKKSNHYKEQNIKLKIENENLFQKVKKENEDLKKQLSSFSEIKNKYNELIDEYDDLEQKLSEYEEQIQLLPKAKQLLEEKILENLEKDKQIDELINKINYFIKNSCDKMEDVIKIIKAFSEIKMNVAHIQTIETRKGVYEFNFKIRDQICDEKKIEKVCNSFPSMFNWATQAPTFYVSRGELVIVFDTRQVDDVIDDAQIDWVSDVSQNESNIAIFGVKGGGKTELITNLMGAILKEVDDAELVYIQPAPEESSIIEFDDYKLMPHFSGFHKSYEGLDYLWSEFKKRSRLNEEVHNSNTSKKYPKFKPIFFIIDELQSLITFANDEEYEQDGKEISSMIVKILSLGRKYKINLITVGQSPDVSSYKWTKSVLTQFNCIYVTRESIKTGMSYLSKYQEKEVETEYKLYHQSNYRKYYALIRIANSYSKIQDLPEQRQYVTGVSVANLIN